MRRTFPNTKPERTPGAWQECGGIVGGGDIDGVDGRRALATSRREGLVRGHADACRFIGDDASLVDDLTHEFEVGGGLSHC